MNNIFKNLFKDNPFIKETFVYGIGNSISALIPIVITPFLTRLFTTSQYGMIDLINTTALIISIFASLDLDVSLLRFYYDDGEKRDLVVSSVFIYSIISSIIFCVLSLLFFTFFKGLIFRTSEELSALYIALMTIPFTVFLANELMLIRVQREASIFVYMSVADLIISLFLTIFLVKNTNLGMKAVFLAILLSQILMCLVGFLYLRKNFIKRFSSEVFVVFKDKILPYSLPLLIPLIIATFLGNISKYFLRVYQSPSSVGIYSVALKIGGVVGLIGIPFRQAWLPYSYSIMNQENAKEKYASFFNIFIILLFILALLTVVFSRWLILLISTKDYLEARLSIGYICLSAIFLNLCGGFFNLGIHIKKKTFFALIAYTLGLSINIILNILLIPKYSIIGAAISTLIGYILIATLLLYFSNKIYFIKYNLPLLVFLTFIFLVFIYLNL